MDTFGKSVKQVIARATAAVIGWARDRDPRVVHLREFSRIEAPLLSRRAISLLCLGGMLVIGAVAVGATRGQSERTAEIEEEVSAAPLEVETRQFAPERVPSPLPAPLIVDEKPHPPREKASQERASRQRARDSVEQRPENGKRRAIHPRFYDPLYVFSPEPVTQVKAYPLADPPGVVVDLMAVAEPSEKPNDFVGQDERVQSIRRRVMPFGLRYILILNIPLTRLDIFHEGNVVMIFPRS